jgi:hypothetical protein
MANKSGNGTQSLPSEYEILRGDLVRIIYGATEDNVEYIPGVERLEQHESRSSLTSLLGTDKKRQGPTGRILNISSTTKKEESA